VILDYLKRSSEWGARKQKTEEPMAVAIVGAKWARYNKHHSCGVCRHVTTACRLARVLGRDSRGCAAAQDTAACEAWNREAWRYGLDVDCAFLRRPSTGWDSKTAITFSLAAMSYQQNLTKGAFPRRRPRGAARQARLR
jgi:hypothetical protein